MTPIPTTAIPTTTIATTATSLSKPALRFRHELKHTINDADCIELSHRLGHLFEHDPHAGSRGTYRVNSLYFDTPYDKAYREKLDSVDRREKFRLRYYNEDTSFIKLEKKFKVRGLCGKHGTRITADEVARLLEGDYAFLLDSGDALKIELYSKLQGQLLRPKTIVSYDREPFRYEPGNTRITIDRNLHTALGSTDFLSPQPNRVEAAEGLAVLEVKYDNYLPDIVRMAVQVPNRRAAAFSKYAMSRRYD